MSNDSDSQNQTKMKKLLLLVVAALCAVTASAQEPGGWTLGPRLSIYTNTGDTVLGVGAVGRYRFDNNWRLEPSVTALLHKGCSIDFSCDAHYVFDLGVVLVKVDYVRARKAHLLKEGVSTLHFADSPVQALYGFSRLIDNLVYHKVRQMVVDDEFRLVRVD